MGKIRKIYRPEDIRPSEITPEHLYRSRRRFISMAALAAGALALGACAAPGTPAGGSKPSPEPTGTEPPGAGAAPTDAPAVAPTGTATGAEEGPLAHAAPYAGAGADDLGDPLTSYEAVTTYNNYYEFTMDKLGVVKLAEGFETSPWKVEVGGLVNNPKTYDVDDLLKKFTQREQISRMRCVEAWSMVIPWVGFPLAELLKEVEPTSKAKYVRFQTVFAPNKMPGQKYGGFSWPYAEGLRLDEAMHELTILATGIYGQPLLPQNGAPIRLVVPWKYGFKFIKSIVKIDLVEEMPVSLWMAASPKEYGFYANVNPDVSHPRWSQASERRIGESGRRYTLPFNGYAEQVAYLYEGMDLKVNF